MIRVAIIGAGIGAEHLAAYRQLPDDYQVQVICDRDVARAEGIADGIAVSADMADVLARDDVDLIDVCLPPHLHYNAIEAALRAGKDVVCEKPLVSSLADADRLISLAQTLKRSLTPVFQYRYGPETAKLRALMAAGLTGRSLVASIETHWHRDSDYYAIPWRGTWDGEQGGAVLGHAIHNHDLLCAVLGPVARLSAFTTTRVNPIETEDCAAISFQMESGALATSSITLGAADDCTRLRFCFENVTVESDLLPYAPSSGRWTFQARGDADQGAIDACIAACPDEPIGFTGFFAALARGQGVTVADGRRSLELVTAIYHAARTGTVVDLPLTDTHPLYQGWTP